MLGSDGNKMSKSLRNYPDVREVFDRDGADAMRWFLMSSPILRGGNLVVTEQGIRDSVRQVMIPLWNSWYFFQLYANAHDGGQGYDAAARTDSTDPLDRYLLAKCRDFVGEMTEALDGYAVADACDATRSFLDVLTNWYIRRSRDRFWEGDADAFDTLYTVLEVVCRATAPLMPLTTEEVWRGLTGGRSVHLADWPLVDELPADEQLVAAMDEVREVCSATSALRKAGNLRNRLPLATLTVVVPDPAALEGFEAIVRDEVNVKAVRLLSADVARGRGVRRRAEAHRQRPRRRPAAGQRRADRDQGLEVGRLVGGRGRHRHRGRAGAGGGRVHPRDRGRLRRRRYGDRGAAQRRVRRARHRGDARARRRGAGPRPGARGPAGPPRRRPGRLRPDRAHVGGSADVVRRPPAPTSG